ncbi:ATP-grasp fold amidoligase family protein [Gracilibacillus phocaeensis]|uniref:ATP-grasp fold amidoligase family protein n=1 Tax=Gracilibacillus phocaeensis TaxID=2042304 RepID=UPI00102F3102|nr:ATP-grasp fold amidoligase family protein [Gracilibacillus phocaeensis]
MTLKKIVNNSLIKGIMNFIFKFLSDKQIIKIQYIATLKRKPNLKEPKRFTEKIQWYKLNYRNSLMTICADKHLVKDYMKRKGYENILVKSYQVCDSFNEIDFDKLPDSFVVKSNKGSGTNMFVKDKHKVNKQILKKEVEKWNNVNTVLMGREWAYKNIKPKIVVEELLVDNTNKTGELNDYKFMCFNGKVKVVWCDVDRYSGHRRNFYDSNWELLEVRADCPNMDMKIPKPKEFKYMKEVAEAIAADFPFVRVDFYEIEGKVYFGEITFYPWSGCMQFTPDGFDYDLGGMLILPDTVNN